MADPLIAVDARTVRPGMTGVGRRVGHLLRVMARRDAGLRWALVTNTPDFLGEWLWGDSPDGGAGRQPPPHVEVWPAPVRPESHPANEWWMSRTLIRQIEDAGVALFHGPAFQAPRAGGGIPIVITVHDMAHRRRPFTQRWRFRRWLHWSIGRGARSVSRIVVPSEAVEHDLVAAHPQAKGRVTVIPGGVDPAWHPLAPAEIEANGARHGLPPKYLVHVGTFEPRKNHRWLLEVFNALCAEIDDPPHLVMIGAEGPTLARVEQWVELSPWRELIEQRIGVDDVALHETLAGAAALLFPSHAEGFGLPVLEALSCGVPVIAADNPGLDGFRRSPATLCRLDDLRGWLDAILTCLRDEAHRERIRREGPAHTAAFRWEAAADRLLALYRELIDQAEA